MGSSSITIKVNGQWDGKAIQQAANDLAKLGNGIKNDTRLWESQAQKVATQTAAWSTSVTSGLAKVSTDLVKTGQEIYAFGDQLSTMGSKLTTGLTVPMVAAGGYAAAMAVQFDTALADVRKTTDMTETELSRLADSALDLSTTQPVSASQILNIEALGAQLGIADSKLESFAQTISGLDIATDLNAETAATQLAQFANITGMADTEYQNFGSTLVDLGNNLAATESQIMNMGLRLAAAGSIAGLTDAQILGLAGAMSSLGIRAEAGGSAMTTVMANISKAVAMGGADLEAFAGVAGMSAEEFATAWEQDAMGALIAMLDGIARLDESGQDMNVTLAELGINEIRQSDAMRRLASNTDLLKDSVNMATSAWQENSALTNEVNSRNESMASRLQVLKNRVDEVAINVGGPLVEALIDVIGAADPLIQAVADAAQAFADMDEGSQRTVLALAGIAAGAGPVLSALGGVTKTVGNFVSAIGHAGQGAAVFRDALETMDGAAIRNYASAGTLESKLGLLGNRVVEAAGGVDNYVKTWEKAYDAQKQVGSIEKKISDAIQTNGKSAHVAAGKVDEYVEALGRQQAAAEAVYEENQGIIDGWKKQADQSGKTASRVDALTRSMKGVDPATMKAADSIENIGSKSRLMGDSLTIAGTKAVGFIKNLAGLAAGGVAIGLVTGAIGLLVGRIEEMNRQQEEMNTAQLTFSEIASGAAASAESEAFAIDNLGKSCEESWQSFLELQKKSAETMRDFETSSATLDDYVGTINELADKSSLSVTEQERLKSAVAGYNEITGDSVSVTDAANGKLSEGIDVINANTEAWKRNAKAQALQQLSADYAKAEAEARLNQATATEELAKANERLNSAQTIWEQADAGEDVKYWSEQLHNANQQLETSAKNQEQLNNSMAALTEEVYPYTQALQGFGDGFATALAQAGTSVDEFAVKMQEAGVSIDTLSQLGPQKIQALADSCEGDVGRMTWAIQAFGTGMTDADAKVAGAAYSIREQLGQLSDTGGMDLDALALALANAGVSTETLNAIGTANLSALAAECQGDINLMIQKILEYNGTNLDSKEAEAKVNGNAVDGTAKRNVGDTNTAIGKMKPNSVRATVSGNAADGSAASNIWNTVSAIGRLLSGGVSAGIRVGYAAAGGIKLHADGGIIPRYHADGAIATRAVPLDIVGEAGAEAIVPLTNKRYAMPFVSMIADETARRMPTNATYNLYIDGASYGTLPPVVKEAIMTVFDECILQYDMMGAR